MKERTGQKIIKIKVKRNKNEREFRTKWKVKYIKTQKSKREMLKDKNRMKLVWKQWKKAKVQKKDKNRITQQKVEGETAQEGEKKEMGRSVRGVDRTDGGNG